MISHSRKKVPKQEEVQEETAKNKALTEKVGVMLTDLKQMRQDPSKFKDPMQYTAVMLNVCPEIPTILNLRRELILKHFATVDANTQYDLLLDELKLIVPVMMKYPKTYGLWHHRKWCIVKSIELEKQHGESIKKKGAILVFELKLCEQFLGKDERNFHVWNYRGWLTDTAANVDTQLLEKELEFIESKLSQNFSNFSALYNKGKNITHLTKLKVDKILEKPDDTVLDESEQFLGKEYFRFDMPLDFIRSEFENVKTGLYMQSKEEPMWLYQRFLLNKVTPLKVRGLVNCGTHDGKVVICVVFSGKIKNLKPENLLVLADKKSVSVEVEKVGSSNYSYLWLCHVSKEDIDGKDLRLQITNNIDAVKTVGDLKKSFESPVEDYNGKRFVDSTPYTFKLPDGEHISFQRKSDSESAFMMLLEEIAEGELGTVKEILELEPENSFAQSQFVYLEEEYLTVPSNELKDLNNQLKRTEEILESYQTLLATQPRHTVRVSHLSKIYHLKHCLILKLLGKGNDSKLDELLADQKLAQLNLCSIYHLLLLNRVYTDKNSDIYRILNKYFNIN